MEKITVVGANGLVGSSVAEFFESIGHQVARVDIGTDIHLMEAARWADVVFIAVMPIERTAHLLDIASREMKKGSLLIHGTSIEQMESPYHINHKQITDLGIALCHWHLHFRPQCPLVKTLFGQFVSVSFRGQGSRKWEKWLEEKLNSSKPIILRLPPGYHDEITSISQIAPVLLSLIFLGVMESTSPSYVHRATEIAGIPAKLIFRAITRHATGPEVLASILTNHPHTLKVLENIDQTIASIKSMVDDRKAKIIVKKLLRANAYFNLAEWNEDTNRIMRMDADWRNANYSIRFPSQKNRPGLLARALAEFTSRGIDLTTTFAQTDPADGSCTFIFGVLEDSAAVKEAISVIEGWLEE